MTGPSEGGPFGGEDITELRQNSGCSDRVMKELFPKVTLRFGCLEEGVRASIRKPWLWMIGFVRWNHQLLDATNLLVDELARLGAAVAMISGGDSGDSNNAQSRDC